LSPKSTSHTNFDSEWENETFENCKFKGLQILNAILNYLVCNMMKVFTRPTSASDFLSLVVSAIDFFASFRKLFPEIPALWAWQPLKPNQN
jgi:hypothetical protein